MEHYIKITPEFFGPKLAGKKPFEIRDNDRDYQEGDTLILQEWDAAAGYTGREYREQILYMTDYMQRPGFVVMGTAPLDGPMD